MDKIQQKYYILNIKIQKHSILNVFRKCFDTNQTKSVQIGILPYETLKAYNFTTYLRTTNFTTYFLFIF